MYLDVGPDAKCSRVAVSRDLYPLAMVLFVVLQTQVEDDIVTNFCHSPTTPGIFRNLRGLLP
jgi:hypothetical protein